MIVLINVTKINKDWIIAGKNGKYIDLVLFENKDGVDQYGNMGFVAQSVTKEEREQNIRGVIVGNWKDTESRSKPKTPVKSRPQKDPDLDPDQEDDIPF